METNFGIYDARRAQAQLTGIFALSETIGVEEASRQTAAALRAGLDAEFVARKAAEIKAREKIKGNDARAALQVLEGIYWDLFYQKSPHPALVTIWRFLLKLLRRGWLKPAEVSPHRVVLNLTGRCPMVEAAGNDLTRCEAVCRANFANQSFTEPLNIALVQAITPDVRWELAAFRSSPLGTCQYALVYQPDVSDKDQVA